MEVEISRCVDGSTVGFSCAFGTGVALWHGPAPAVGSRHDVELDIPGIHVWGVDLRVAPQANFAICCTGGTSVTLVLSMESVAEDGCAGMWLGGHIILLETTGSPYPAGTFVEVATDALALYPTGM